MPNAKNIKLILFNFWLLFVTAASSADFYVYTPKGTQVGVYDWDDFSEANKQYWENYVDSAYPNAIFLDRASYSYNCHSFAWYMSEALDSGWSGGDTGWMETWPSMYWGDSSYIEQTTSPSNRGEKVFYIFGAHTAIQTTVDGMLDSKWGYWSLMRHARNYCPYDTPYYYYPSILKYYTHFGRITDTEKVHGKIFRNQYYNGYPIAKRGWRTFDRRIASNADLTVDSSTVDSGAKVDFAASGTIYLGPGFVVENGATVTVRSWGGGGLLKRAVAYGGSNSHSRQNKDNFTARTAVPVKNDFRVMSAKSAGFRYECALPQPCNVGIAVFDIQGRLISKSDLGNKTAGYFSGTCALSRNRSGMYIVKAVMGDAVMVKKLIVPGSHNF